MVQGDGVSPDNHIARHHPGRGAALVHIGAGQIADDLGKLRPGDLGLGVELAIGAGDVAVLHQGGHRVCGPGGDLSLVGKVFSASVSSASSTKARASTAKACSRVMG